MSDVTKIKDPLYGYIKIEDIDVIKILNSPAFHRLSDIIQTSYSSVFPTSTHTRFTHSLGVYYLGKMASRSLKKSFDSLHETDFSKEAFEKLEKLFLLACLLHDVGHAPFSHTGENFYLEDKQNPIWNQLCTAVSDTKFNSDSKGDRVGAPHEIMSALTSLQLFPELFSSNDDKSFFARCIIGLKYSDTDICSSIKNCFIELLNSNTIDVDKLDYLLRDSFVTGFSSVSIDYRRLLSAVCIVKQESKIILAFNKSALSTLESVILAHDMERKWIQNHPVIQYENYLVEYIISESIKYYQQRNISLFSYSTLTETGSTNCIPVEDFLNYLKKTVKNKPVIKWLDENFEEISKSYFDDKGISLEAKIRLLSDSDIISTAKNCLKKNDIIAEYFDRSARKKSFWKSESEYRILFEQGGSSPEALRQLEDRFQSIVSGLKTANKLPIINDDALEYFKNKAGVSGVFPDYKAVEEKEIKITIDLLEMLKGFAKEHGIPFEFVTISAKQFNTGFNKLDFKEINVYFPNLEQVSYLKDTIHLFGAEEATSNFFYLYAKIQIRESDVIYDLVHRLETFATEHHQKPKKN